MNSKNTTNYYNVILVSLYYFANQLTILKRKLYLCTLINRNNIKLKNHVYSKSY